MKKSVAVIFALTILGLFLVATDSFKSLTGWQVLDLPEPPPIPGLESDQQTSSPTETIPTPPPVQLPTPTTETANLPTGEDLASIIKRLDAIEGLLPGWEDRLNNIEAQVAIASNIVARVDALESQVNALRVDVDNLKSVASRPYVDQPTFFEELRSLGRKNTILSVLLSVFVLAIVISMIVSNIMERRKEYLADKRILKQYLVNYQRAGYKLDTLRMHLLASGWKDKFIDEVMSEINKK